MNLLVLGAGGREHALAWKISQSPSCKKVYLHPGNAGCHQADIPDLGNIDLDDLDTLSQKARDLDISLVVIGPEVLLAKGYADHFRKEGFAVVGPSKNSAQLESSKIFAKEFMSRSAIPTAPFSTANTPDELFEQMEARETWPVVLKLDGLAAGKGVAVAQNFDDVEEIAK